MSQNFKSRGCQWYEVKRIKSIFANNENGETRFGTSLLPQVVFSFLQ